MLQVTFNEADRILLDMADDAEAASQYNQQNFGDGCGTPACMLGTYGWLHPKSFVTDYLRAQIKYLADQAVYPEAQFWKLLDGLEITEFEFDELFEWNGCGSAMADGKKAAAYVREFVRKRALARIEA